MRSPRDSIAGLMGVVLITALSMAALKTGSEVWAGGAWLAACAILCLCVVGVVCRGRAERPRWLGAALFGWGYFVMAFGLAGDSRKVATIAVLDAVWSTVTLPLPPTALAQTKGAPSGSPNFELAGHCLWAIAFAALGGSLSARLFAHRMPDESTNQSLSTPTKSVPVSPYRPLVTASAGLVLVALTAALGVGLSPGIWAGLVFLVTCGFLGIVALGAVLSPAERRANWLGPALFGMGYIILAFGWQPREVRWPPLPTVLLLEELRPSIPVTLNGYPYTTDNRAFATRRIVRWLEEPIPLHFPNETPLKDVLLYIQKATSTPDHAGISMYVDPVGLLEVKKSLESPVLVDLEGVPLKDGLSSCLKQLGLDYHVKDGFVMITDHSNVERLPPGLYPYMTVGQCLLAMVAAMLGAVASLIVTGRATRSGAQAA